MDKHYTPNASYISGKQGTRANYSDRVLVGNWYNSRLSTDFNSRGIVPGLMAEPKAIRRYSVYKDSYVPSREDLKKQADDYVNLKLDAFNNSKCGVDSRIKFWDSDAFLQNCTTTNEIAYKVRPERERNAADEQERKSVVKRNRDEDITESYGNRTNFGLRKLAQCNLEREKCRRRTVTTYMDSFRHPTAPSTNSTECS